MIQCVGCGAMIQTTDSEQAGYLPASALAKKEADADIYCQRCFRLRHYNELQDVPISDDVFLEKLSQIADQDALIINLIDIFDVEGSMIPSLSRFIGNQAFIVAANKFDLLPKVTREDKVLQWLKKTLHDNGLFPTDIMVLSANKPQSLMKLTELIEATIQFKDIYIVGTTNVGKSTLINQLIRHYGGQKEIITTSNHPGTTLDMIRIPFTDQHSLIDTPGIIRPSQLAHYLSMKEIKTVLPSKPLKPKTYQLNAGQTIFLAGLARIDYVKGERNSFTYYVSNDCYIHRTKFAEADEFYRKHLGGLLSPPSAERSEDFPKLVPQTIKLKANQDVAISGLGWLTTHQAVEIVVWVPKGVGLSIRDAII
ncbi:ribosome biogenesis GTPase YqeH [Vaginisenegalia massiliensis]|uniref:ribosome biogenesis GTPase YqeH n=1 Tax=Vaginisenegalia massiliensis TaxID=2058294 RepID=UPI000F53A2AD|nr:ribosome biogenesis GTPase YqeH [Vaginisenegalia massiliensis]